MHGISQPAWVAASVAARTRIEVPATNGPAAAKADYAALENAWPVDALLQHPITFGGIGATGRQLLHVP